MKNLFNISLVLALAALAGCATSPEAATPETSNSKPQASNAATAAAAKPKTVQDRLRELVKNQNDPKNKVGTAEAIANLEKFRQTEPDCTNALVRYAVDCEILRRCKGSPRRVPYDAKAAGEALERVAPRIYDDPAIYLNWKYGPVLQHATWLCDQGRFDDAIKLARHYTDMNDAKGRPCGDAYRVQKSVYRLANRYADAKAAILKAIELSGGHANAVGEAIALVTEFNDIKAIPEILNLHEARNREYHILCWAASHRTDYPEIADFRDAALKRILPYAADRKNPASLRMDLVDRAGLVEDTPNGAALRFAVKDLLDEGKVNLSCWPLRNLRFAFMDADWRRFATVYPDFTNFKSFKAPELRRAHVFSLGALGRLAEAKEYAAKYRAEAEKPVDRLKMDTLLAVIEGRDALPLVAAAKLPPKENIQVIQLAGQWALELQKNDACRRYAEAYAKLVKPIPRRRQNVTWTAKPIDGESAYRTLWPKLEKSFIDVKMCGDLDNLVTDVATGRVTVEKTDKDTKDAKVEVTTCCDVKGLHIFLRVIDPNARAVEEGFAGGKGTEMYFAPGDNEPYVCFGGEPRNPISFLFGTTYTWKEHQRIVKDTPASPYNMVGETWFSDEDYVEHLFFPWDAYYQKLPKAGTEWKFESLMDGYSWGGSQSVHECSSWGRLVFDLKPEELTAIRRRILIRNAKTWKNGDKRSFITVARFDRWADPALGDPDFYKACLKQLEDELDAYAKRVRPEMTDADVNDIYEHAVPRWIGLKHEIDKRRRDYLKRKALGF